MHFLLNWTEGESRHLMRRWLTRLSLGIAHPCVTISNARISYRLDVQALLGLAVFVFQADHLDELVHSYPSEILGA